MYNTSEQTRYYDPEIGRFISPDSTKYLDPETIHGLNLYAYCYNNPIMFVDYLGKFPIAIEAINTFISGIMELYGLGLKCSLKALEKSPKINIEIAKKMARKGGHVQSARQIIRDQQNVINSTRNSIDDIAKAGKNLGKILLVADIAWSLGENLLSGEESWISDTIVDASLSLAIYGLGLLPGGFIFSLAATAATLIWEDEIEAFKDDFYDAWNQFWSFSWI